jgi:hypothetical protein
MKKNTNYNLSYDIATDKYSLVIFNIDTSECYLNDRFDNFSDAFSLVRSYYDNEYETAELKKARIRDEKIDSILNG